MNFHVEQPYLYSHLKMWFTENAAKLPRTLDTPHFVVIDLPKCLDISIFCIEQDIERNGKPTKDAKVYKDRLVSIYLSLQVPKNHNKQLERIEEAKRI